MQRFALAPRSGRSQIVGVLAFPVTFAFTGVVMSIDDGRPWVIAVASVVGVGVLAAVGWLWRRAAPTVLAIDGDELVLETRTGPVRGSRRDLRAEVGYTQLTGRNTGGVKYRAIALSVAGRRLIVQSSAGGEAPGGKRLGGQVFVLPPDRFERLCELLRLRRAIR